MDSPIARYFKFAERGTNILTETRAGLTTFMVMAYIIFRERRASSGARARSRLEPSRSTPPAPASSPAS